jgi:2-aminoadipate transaminase
MVSLAGGVPDPAGFPLEAIPELAVRVIDKYPESAFQYGQTEGFGPLREVLAERLRREGIQAKAEDVLVFSGSQEVLDALAKVLISEGDKIAVEAPTYLGALQAFNPYGPAYVCLESDENGIVPASL